MINSVPFYERKRLVVEKCYIGGYQLESFSIGMNCSPWFQSEYFVLIFFSQVNVDFVLVISAVKKVGTAEIVDTSSEDGVDYVPIIIGVIVAILLLVTLMIILVMYYKRRINRLKRNPSQSVLFASPRPSERSMSDSSSKFSTTSDLTSWSPVSQACVQVEFESFPTSSTYFPQQQKFEKKNSKT